MSHTIDIELPGDRHLTGTLQDSATTASLIAQLPLTLNFSDFGAQEKIASLPAEFDQSGAPRQSAAPAGTIAYYAPARSLVLYYENVGVFAGIMPVGTFTDPAALRSLRTSFTATVRLAS